MVSARVIVLTVPTILHPIRGHWRSPLSLLPQAFVEELDDVALPGFWLRVVSAGVVGALDVPHGDSFVGTRLDERSSVTFIDDLAGGDQEETSVLCAVHR